MTVIVAQVTDPRAGHVHRAATGLVGGCAVFVCSSSYVKPIGD